jgi:hypothetical protein
MTATIAASQAALKVLYPNGEIPASIQKSFVTLNRLKKEKDFVGELMYVPIQNAYPQGSSGDLAEAQSNVFQGNYLRFALTRVSHYGVARITGEAAEAAVKTEGAMVDLWENETKGIASTELAVTSTYLWGDGDGVLGQLASAVAATTITMAAGTNMNYFELNMTLRAVSTTGLSPTLRVGGAARARVTGINRRSGTLTFSANLNTLITDVTATDYFVRSGDQSVGGANNAVILGIPSYVVGGATPGTLLGLNRNQDPVRLAGQSVDYTGWAMEDAVVDASAQAGFQGIGTPTVLIANNIEVAAMKKSLGGKIEYERPGSTAGVHGFSKVTIEGDNGPIEILGDPFMKRNRAYLLKLDEFSIKSLGAWPHLGELDGLKFQRLSNADAYEVRFVSYGNTRCKNPGPHVYLQNFGA